MRTGYRCIGFVLMAFCAAGQVSTQAVYDAGQNLISNMAGSASNPYKDGNGGLWTYGRTANAYHASVQFFTHTYRENGLSGFLDTASFGVPLVMVNTTGQELMRTDIGSLPIATGEIVTHPASVSQSPYCTIVRFTVPHSSIYEATVAAHDITPNGDGALISLAVNGKVFQEECLNISDAIASKTLRLNAHYLPKGSTIDFVVDPRGGYECDGTAFSFCVAELERLDVEPVVDVNKMFRNNLASANPVMPYSENNATLSCGCLSNGTPYAYTVFTSTASPSPLAVGFSNAENFPFVLANTNEAAYSDYGQGDYKMSAGNSLMPEELIAHPASYGPTYISLTVPSNGIYRVVAICRDLNRLDGDGVQINIYIGGNQCVASEIIPGVGDIPLKVTSADALSLTAGEEVSILVDPRENYYCDSTALQVLLLAGRSTAGYGIVNMDFNGYESDDALPTAAVVFHGAAHVGSTNAYWNSVSVPNKTLESISLQKMKLANAKTTLASFTMAAPAGGTLGGDWWTGNGENVLLRDYIYVAVGETNTFTFSGLYPGAQYDLYLYSGLGCSQLTVFKVRDDAHFGNELKCFTTSGDYAFFPKVPADAAGCITGSFYCTESFGNIAGFQLMGSFPLPPAGTVIRLL